MHLNKFALKKAQNIVIQMSRFSKFRATSKWCYEKVAHSVVRQLLNTPGVVQVHWRGGSVIDCAPGLSDIDLTILTEPKFKKIYPEVAKKIQRLKMFYPLIGEPLILSRENWHLNQQFGSAFTAIAQNRVEFSKKEIRRITEHALLPMAKYQAALIPYLSNFQTDLRTNSGQKRLQRNADKILGFSKNRALPASASLADFFHQAYLALDQLSLQALGEEPKQPEKPPHEQPAELYPSRFAGLLVAKKLDPNHWKRFIDRAHPCLSMGILPESTEKLFSLGFGNPCSVRKLSKEKPQAIARLLLHQATLLPGTLATEAEKSKQLLSSLRHHLQLLAPETQDQATALHYVEPAFNAARHCLGSEFLLH